MSKVQIPDIIKTAAVKAGILAEDDSSGFLGTGTYMSPDLQSAYLNGDYNAITNFQNMSNNDINPIYSNIQNNGDTAWNSYVQSNGDTVYVSISGQPSNPSGYMWVYTPGNGSSSNAFDATDAAANGITAVPVTQVGTLSVSASTLGIQNTVWENPGVTISMGVISILSFILIKKVFTSLFSTTPAETVAGEAAGEAVTEGVITAGTADALMASFAAFAGAALFSVAILIVVYVIIKFAVKQFYLTMNVWNWDQSDRVWTVNAEFGNNEVNEDDNGFQNGVLNPPNLTFTLPNGFQQPATNPFVSYAAYNFTNNDTFLNGVGVALNVSCSDGNALQLKYIIHAMEDNQLGLKGDPYQSISDFYNDSSSWLSNTTSYSTTCAGNGVPLFCSTDALGGVSDNAYTFDVHIGNQVSSTTASAPAADQANKKNPKQELQEPVRSRMEALPWPPKIPVVVGRHILNPDGTKQEHDGKLKLATGEVVKIHKPNLGNKKHANGVS